MNTNVNKYNILFRNNRIRDLPPSQKGVDEKLNSPIEQFSSFFSTNDDIETATLFAYLYFANMRIRFRGWVGKNPLCKLQSTS